MNDFKLKTLVLGMIQTNCYIISNETFKEAIVIDPADQPEKIEQYLNANDLVCKGILLTHGHFDHILGVNEFVKSTHADIYAQETEAELLKNPVMNLSVEFGRNCSITADHLLKDEQLLKLAGFSIKVIHTPGHTLGGTSYYFPDLKILFSGDTLFCGSVGRTDFPTGDGKVLIESIQKKLMILEDQVSVYPGHGMPTTIGNERDNIKNISQNTIEDWD